MKKLNTKDIPAYGDYDRGETLDCGKGYTAIVKTAFDDCHGEPWNECDGHGPVSGWENRDKYPGELVLSEDRGFKRFYGFAEAVKTARKEGWNTPPYDTVETAGERAHRAAMADYEYLRKWCNGEGHYVGVMVTVYRNGAEIAEDSLWGVEDFGDYWRETAADMVNSAIDADIEDRKKAAAAARKETIGRKFWECRDTVTA